MIINLEDAEKIDENITQDDLDAFETAVRALTNNNFQDKNVRFKKIEIKEPNIIVVDDEIKGLRKDDTLEINYSQFNDGLYTIDEINANEIKVIERSLFDEINSDMMLTLVSYPADIKQGIKKLIEYDTKMSGKIGIKSETISRMSTTYYDMNAQENIDGYPAALLSFLGKYEKMRWG